MTDRVQGPGGAGGYGQVIRRRGGAKPPQDRFGDALDLALREVAAPEVRGPGTGVEFSRHALARLESRGVGLGGEELARLEEAIDQLAAHGARESLILTDENAYVVGIPKRRVITLMERSDLRGQIFTQIDSTFVTR
ncbi:MAG: hypothetical protein JXX28_12350 [Deltaproteobacteria bacterium]|nr:hypothetical protein [Deltaproteobacteria bacterium]